MIHRAQLRDRFATILVGTDLTARGQAAHRAAFDLATWIPALRIHLAHCVQLPVLMAEAGGPSSLGPSGRFGSVILEKELFAAKEALEAIRVPASSRVEVSREARIGDPSRELAGIAEDIDADLLVVATHQRGRVGRFVFGSVVDTLIRHSPCPVLVVSDQRPLHLPFANVLAALDDSEVSSAVLDTAFALSSPEGGVVWVLEVVEDAADAAAVGTALERLVERTLARDLTVKVAVRDGKVRNAIGAFAAEVRADLLVLGTSGRRPWERLWGGHTADEVAARAHSPVLVVPHSALERSDLG